MLSLKDDELVIVQGKLQPDRFSGGLRLAVTQVWDLAAARCRFGRYLKLSVNGRVPPIAEVLKGHPPRKIVTEQGPVTQGLGIRLHVHRTDVSAELDLGEDAWFFPSDDALAIWEAAGGHGGVEVVYQ